MGESCFYGPELAAHGKQGGTGRAGLACMAATHSHGISLGWLQIPEPGDGEHGLRHSARIWTHFIVALLGALRFGRVFGLAVHDDSYRWLPGSSVDLVFTVPPLNIAQGTNFHTYAKNAINSYRFDQGKGWDSHAPGSFIDLLSDWAHEFVRVLRPGKWGCFAAGLYLKRGLSEGRQLGEVPWSKNS